MQHEAYRDAAKGAAATAGAQFIDLIYKYKYEMANTMMEVQNPHRDGMHLTKAVNIFLYRNVKSKLDEMGLSSSKMPRHWPATLSGAYPTFADDDGRIKKYVPKKKA